jgi:cytochrome c-type biogenesis protein CcmH/NrfG
MAYKHEGKADEAIKELEAAVADNPRHGMAWSSLGNLYKQKSDLPNAVKAYEMATQVIKKDKNLWENLGMAYYRNKQVDQALEALTTACRIDPDAAIAQLSARSVVRRATSPVRSSISRSR